MADVCDDDGVSGASLRRKGAEKLLFFFILYAPKTTLVPILNCRDTIFTPLFQFYSIKNGFPTPPPRASPLFSGTYSPIGIFFRLQQQQPLLYNSNKITIFIQKRFLKSLMAKSAPLSDKKQNGTMVAVLYSQVLCHEEWQMCVMMMGYQAQA